MNQRMNKRSRQGKYNISNGRTNTQVDHGLKNNSRA